MSFDVGTVQPHGKTRDVTDAAAPIGVQIGQKHLFVPRDLRAAIRFGESGEPGHVDPVFQRLSLLGPEDLEIGVQEVEEGLLTSGLYRYFRHPIYTGILWVTLGLALLIRNPDGLLMFLPILIWLFVGTMLEEKLDMCMRFPEEYRKYKGM